MPHTGLEPWTSRPRVRPQPTRRSASVHPDRSATHACAPRLGQRSVTISQPAEACFDAYSQLERIPEWNPILGRVKVISPTRSEWSARLPPALARIIPNCEWTSQQCLDASECTISWQSVSGVDTSGVAIFEPDGPESCVFTLTISYSLPGWLTPVATSPLVRVGVRLTLILILILT